MALEIRSFDDILTPITYLNLLDIVCRGESICFPIVDRIYFRHMSTQDGVSVPDIRSRILARKEEDRAIPEATPRSAKHGMMLRDSEFTITLLRYTLPCPQ